MRSRVQSARDPGSPLACGHPRCCTVVPDPHPCCGGDRIHRQGPHRRRRPPHYYGRHRHERREKSNEWTKVLSTLTQMGNVPQTQRLAAASPSPWRCGSGAVVNVAVDAGSSCYPAAWVIARIFQFGVAWIVDRDRDAISLLGTNVGAFPSGGVMRIVIVTGAAVFLAAHYERSPGGHGRGLLARCRTGTGRGVLPGAAQPALADRRDQRVVSVGSSSASSLQRWSSGTRPMKRSARPPPQPRLPAKGGTVDCRGSPRSRISAPRAPR